VHLPKLCIAGAGLDSEALSRHRILYLSFVELQSNEENKIAAEYLKNYQKAVFTIRRCWQENELFASLTKVGRLIVACLQ